MTTPSRRAPRLPAQERIARHMTRRGRFARLEPTKARELPSWPKVVGVLGWAGLLGGVLYKAWSTDREQRAGAP